MMRNFLGLTTIGIVGNRILTWISCRFLLTPLYNYVQWFKGYLCNQTTGLFIQLSVSSLASSSFETFYEMKRDRRHKQKLLHRIWSNPSSRSLALVSGCYCILLVGNFSRDCYVAHLLFRELPLRL